ncbi:MAG: RNA polymerase sigma factor [Pseudomonadota bacterium]
MSNDTQNLSLSTFLDEREDLLALARSVVGRVDVAEDLVQESWLRWDASDYPQDHAKPIFVRIIKNLAADWHRKRTVEAKNHSMHALLRGETPDTERIVIARDQVRRIAAALSELPKPTVTAFRMSRLDGLTYEQIGQRLGTSKATAYRMVAQALVRIVVHLDM